LVDNQGPEPEKSEDLSLHEFKRSTISMAHKVTSQIRAWRMYFVEHPHIRLGTAVELPGWGQMRLTGIEPTGFILSSVNDSKQVAIVNPEHIEPSAYV
jgi:hypothetical protein